jgi:hypothetical protein
MRRRAEVERNRIAYVQVKHFFPRLRNLRCMNDYVANGVLYRFCSRSDLNARQGRDPFRSKVVASKKIKLPKKPPNGGAQAP